MKLDPCLLTISTEHVFQCLDACRVRATQGEIVETLKDVFGTYREQARI